MEGSLKVTPERLITAAGEFSEIGSKVKGITEQMMEGIGRLRGVWQGEAADAYHHRFQTLHGDMDKMYRMIQEHVEDLQEMARQYQEAETVNAQESQALKNDL